MAAGASFEEFYAGTVDRLLGQLFLVTGDLHAAEEIIEQGSRATWALAWSRRDHVVFCGARALFGGLHPRLHAVGPPTRLRQGIAPLELEPIQAGERFPVNFYVGFCRQPEKDQNLTWWVIRVLALDGGGRTVGECQATAGPGPTADPPWAGGLLAQRPRAVGWAGQGRVEDREVRPP